jgi:2-polyprenyl-6-methoxyphenol hydroxylase-like FAD-dependent oxidoreductase
MTDRRLSNSSADGRTGRAVEDGGRARDSSSAEVQVQIVGGGIGGLALAGFLRQHGGESVIVKEASQRSGAGYGSTLGNDSLSMLDELRVLDGIVEAGNQVGGWAMRATGGEVLTRMGSEDDTSPMTVIERSQLHDQLRTVVPQSTVHADTAVRALDGSRRGVEVEFSDGVREQFDVVVGADGLRSRVRELIEAGGERFCNTTGWTFRTEPDVDTSEGLSEVWASDGTAFLHMPLGEGSLGWLMTYADEEGTYEEYTIPDLRETFKRIE